MARVPEVLPAAELEGFLAGLIIAMPRKPVYGAAVGDDVEEAQEFAVEAPAGGDDARQESVLESGISGPAAVHLGASGALEDPTDRIRHSVRRVSESARRPPRSGWHATLQTGKKRQA